MVHTNYITNSNSFVSLSASYFRTKIFFLMYVQMILHFSQGKKQIKHNKEIIYLSYVVYKVVEFKQRDWIKIKILTE